MLDTTRNRGTFSATRLNLQYNNRFDEGKRIELRAGVGSGGADFNFSLAGRDATGKPTVDRVTSGDNTNRQATLASKYSQYAGEAHTVTAGAEIEQRTRNEQRRTVENSVDLLPGLEASPSTPASPAAPPMRRTSGRSARNGRPMPACATSRSRPSAPAWR